MTRRTTTILSMEVRISLSTSCIISCIVILTKLSYLGGNKTVSKSNSVMEYKSAFSHLKTWNKSTKRYILEIRKMFKNTLFNLKNYTFWAILKASLVFKQFLSANSLGNLRWKVLYRFLLIYLKFGKPVEQWFPPPPKIISLVVVVGLVWSHDLESYTGGALASGRSHQARQVKG